MMALARSDDSHLITGRAALEWHPACDVSSRLDFAK